MANKIDFFITARPSWSRVKSILLNYIKINGDDSVVVSLTGPALSERYGNIYEQIPGGVRIKTFPSLREGTDFASLTLSSLDGAAAACQSWDNDRPDLVLVVADRLETLGISMSAASMQIPLVHLQGGEISGSIDDKIRDTNSKLADYHLTTNDYTFQNLVAIGESPNNIKIIGCPSIDILNQRMILNELVLPFASNYGGVGGDFPTNKPYGIIFFHPDTLNSSQNLLWIKLIYEMISKSDLNWFWFWPNPDYGSSEISKSLRVERENSRFTNVRYLKNLSPESFMDLAINSKILIGNSSFGIREASFLGLPVINLGKRQLGRQRSSNVIDIENPRSFYHELIHHSKKHFNKEKIYGNGDSGIIAAEFLTIWNPILKLRKSI